MKLFGTFFSLCRTLRLLSSTFAHVTCRRNRRQIKKATQNKPYSGAFFYLLFYHSKKYLSKQKRDLEKLNGKLNPFWTLKENIKYLKLH